MSIGAISVGVRLLAIEVYHSPHLMLKLRVTGTVPSFPRTSLCSIRGQFYLNFFYEIFTISSTLNGKIEKLKTPFKLD